MNSLDYFERHLDQYLGELQALTEIEAPTGDLENLDRAAAYISELLDPLGDLTSEDLEDTGRLLHVDRQGTGPRVLLLAHYDTVWPPGSWPAPWRIDDGRAYGPGVYDMKGGLIFIPWLLRYLEFSGLAHPHLEVLLNPDEEIGSPASRGHIEEAARRADFVLVLEPTNLAGDLKLERKGSGEYVVTVQGRATHQGVEPERGVNAVVEAAHQVLRLLELEDPALGTTVGPNIIEGGRASNMVPDHAEIRVDVRAWSLSETERIDAALHGLRPKLDGARVHVSGGWNRPPMEASDASCALFAHARDQGAGLGLDLKWVRWGGSSDANLAAATGATTVDGFGPVGEGAHQLDECIVIREVPRRLALLAELVISLAGLQPVAPELELSSAPSEGDKPGLLTEFRSEGGEG
jgi:glutamate carboxypeptidase